MSIEWNDSFSTGVAAIDNQHRQLFDLLNQLEAMKQRGDSAAKMMEIVRSLASYAQDHFSYEEGCMERCACAVGAVNKLAHQRFLRMVEGTLKQFGNTTPPRDLFDMLHREMQDWINSHICKIDVQLRKHASLL